MAATDTVETPVPTPPAAAAGTPFTETWENVSPVTNWVWRLDVRGEPKAEMIAGPRLFRLTTEERLVTSERVLDVRDDPFRNGCFRPVAVPAALDIKANPNALSDNDIERILRASELAWDEYVTLIDAPATLRRMIEAADSITAAGGDISLRRYNQLQARLTLMSPKRRVTQKDTDAYEAMGGDAPTSPARPSLRTRGR